MSNLTDKKLTLPLALSLFVLFLTHSFPFFWDSIQLVSKQATHIYTSGNLLLPDEIDSGHPPGFSAYVSLYWKVFGRNLFASHLSMLPILVVLFYQLIALCQKLSSRYWYYLLVVVLVEPVFLGQLCLVSPDVALLAFLLLMVNSLITYQRKYLLLTILLLSIISTRAWMIVIAVFFVDFFHLSKGRSLKDRLYSTIPYVLGSIPAQIYLITHYISKGWVGYHKDSPWIESLTIVPIKQMIFNIGILGWRLLDYGRFAIWLLLFQQIYANRKNLAALIQREKTLLLLWLGCIIILMPAIISRNGIIAPRYLLPGIVFFNLWVVKGLFPDELKVTTGKLTAYVVVVVSLLIGSFWVYPFKIAQAWDATPIHVIYHSHESKALSWFEKERVNLQDVGTVFPSIGPVDYRKLNGNRQGFVESNLTNDYLLISSVHNDWQFDSFTSLEKKYTLEIEWKGLNIFTRIYKKRSGLEHQK